MTDLPPALKDFKKISYHTLEGNIYAPFWRGELLLVIDLDYDDPMTSAQISVIESILSHQDDLRPTYAKKVFDYYQASIYDKFTAFGKNGEDITDQVAPCLTNPSQIWDLVSSPYIYISSLINEDRQEFALLGDCRWDDEHGLGVLVRDWQIVEVSQENNFL